MIQTPGVPKSQVLVRLGFGLQTSTLELLALTDSKQTQTSTKPYKIDKGLVKQDIRGGLT